tara:strand:- start:1076 stop:2269 length:1194 start_codon:yes stop_codon:yes gene_type:complete
MNIIIFEDNNVNDLKPFSINHASFEIKTGIYSNLQRILNNINSVVKNINIYLVVRNELKDIIQEKFPKFTVNPKIIPEGLYLNGAAVWNWNFLEQASKGYAFSSCGNLTAFKYNKNIPFNKFGHLIDDISKVTSDIDVKYISYMWDCLEIEELYNDYLDCLKKDYQSTEEYNYDKSIIRIGTEIALSPTCKIEPGCILDSSKGPIVINKNTIIEAGAIIKGPVFIDNNSTIKSGSKLNGKIIIGPKCKIGGEISNTIFHGFSNKVHDGFVGNCYIGEWVNLGANTNNSNLKNNYSKVKFIFSNKIIETDKLFLGAMIGDYTRTGISTMINTGSYFGLGANIFGSGFQKKYIPSFSWGKDEVVDFNKFISTIKIIKKRRNEKLSDLELIFLQNLYKNN